MSTDFFTELSAEQVAEAHRRHNITSWSAQSGPMPMVVTGGAGCWFWDSNGKKYLDFQSQLVNLNLGHQHPAIVQAIKKQAESLCYIGPSMANDARSELALEISKVTPGDLNKTFFTTGGAAAIENAVRLARHITGRQKVLARYRSYHGATATALTISGDPRRWFAEPAAPGVVRIQDPYCYRCPFGHTTSCGVCQGSPHLEEILQFENPKSVAAVIVEPITGTNGILVPPDGYLAGLRETCDKYGIVLIFDEVMSGFGRSGEWFACDHWDVTPDILCVAKGLNSGYVPLGAMIVSDKYEKWLSENVFPGGLTYSGHPLACASGVASLRAYHEEKVIENARAMGAYLMDRLSEMKSRHPSIGDVRGKGLFIGVELVKNRETREPFVPFNAKGEANKPMSTLLSAAMAKGLYLSSYSNIIRLTPPLIVNREEIDFACVILDELFAAADSSI